MRKNEEKKIKYKLKEKKLILEIESKKNIRVIVIVAGLVIGLAIWQVFS